MMDTGRDGDKISPFVSCNRHVSYWFGFVMGEIGDELKIEKETVKKEP
jgi:hypothetical protein